MLINAIEKATKIMLLTIFCHPRQLILMQNVRLVNSGKCYFLKLITWKRRMLHQIKVQTVSDSLHLISFTSSLSTGEPRITHSGRKNIKNFVTCSCSCYINKSQLIQSIVEENQIIWYYSRWIANSLLTQLIQWVYSVWVVTYQEKKLWENNIYE